MVIDISSGKNGLLHVYLLCGNWAVMNIPMLMISAGNTLSTFDTLQFTSQRSNVPVATLWRDRQQKSLCAFSLYTRMAKCLSKNPPNCCSSSAGNEYLDRF